MKLFHLLLAFLCFATIGLAQPSQTRTSPFGRGTGSANITDNDTNITVLGGGAFGGPITVNGIPVLTNAAAGQGSPNQTPTSTNDYFIGSIFAQNFIAVNRSAFLASNGIPTVSYASPLYGVAAGTNVTVYLTNTFYQPPSANLTNWSLAATNLYPLAAAVQPGNVTLTNLAALANGSGYLNNNGSGTLSWGTPAGGSGSVNITDSGTNILVKGGVLASAGAFTNSLTLNGIAVLTNAAAFQPATANLTNWAIYGTNSFQSAGAYQTGTALLTNVQTSIAGTTATTNLNVIGKISANGGVFTNTLTLGGNAVLTNAITALGFTPQGGSANLTNWAGYGTNSFQSAGTYQAGTALLTTLNTTLAGSSGTNLNVIGKISAHSIQTTNLAQTYSDLGLSTLTVTAPLTLSTNGTNASLALTLTGIQPASANLTNWAIYGTNSFQSAGTYQTGSSYLTNIVGIGAPAAGSVIYSDGTRITNTAAYPFQATNAMLTYAVANGIQPTNIVLTTLAANTTWTNLSTAVTVSSATNLTVLGSLQVAGSGLSVFTNGITLVNATASKLAVFDASKNLTNATIGVADVRLAATKVTRQITLRSWDYVQALSMLAANTNDVSASSFMRPVFSNSAATNLNRMFWITHVPDDLDTGVDLTARLMYKPTAADTATNVFFVGMADVASSAAIAATTGTFIQMNTIDASGASGDLEVTGEYPLTGWRSAMTAKHGLLIELQRAGNHSLDASTADSEFYELILTYTSTQ